MCGSLQKHVFDVHTNDDNGTDFIRMTHIHLRIMPGGIEGDVTKRGDDVKESIKHGSTSCKTIYVNII